MGGPDAGTDDLNVVLHVLVDVVEHVHLDVQQHVDLDAPDGLLGQYPRVLGHRVERDHGADPGPLLARLYNRRLRRRPG